MRSALLFARVATTVANLHVQPEFDDKIMLFLHWKLARFWPTLNKVLVVLSPAR